MPRTAWWLTGITAATVMAWLGFFIHNLADLPGQTLLNPESLYPTIPWLVGLMLWFVPTTRTAGAWVLLIWTAINLVGGVLSVLPLPFLPFEPEQSARHYLFHTLYAAAQLPLIVATLIWLRRRTRRVPP